MKTNKNKGLPIFVWHKQYLRQKSKGHTQQTTLLSLEETYAIIQGSQEENPRQKTIIKGRLLRSQMWLGNKVKTIQNFLKTWGRRQVSFPYIVPIMVEVGTPRKVLSWSSYSQNDGQNTKHKKGNRRREVSPFSAIEKRTLIWSIFSTGRTFLNIWSHMSNCSLFR